MSIRDGVSGRLEWEYSDWPSLADQSQRPLVISLPKRILSLSVVSREVVFSSEHELTRLRLIQTVTYDDSPVEEWTFAFGFVMPNSVNSWQSTVSADDTGTLTPDVLNGHTHIITAFYDGDNMVYQNKISLNYI